MRTTIQPLGPGVPADQAVEVWRQPPGARIREVRWDDPFGGLGEAATRSGRDLMEALASGELPPPPVAVLLGFAPTRIADGHVTMSTHPGEHHLNPLGTAHGGVIATLLDSAMGCAVQTTLPAGTAYATIDLHVRFLRPVLAGGPAVHAQGEVIHRGRRTRTADGRLVDDDGRLYAHATTTCQLVAFAAVA